jgi:hypothetical protein
MSAEALPYPCKEPSHVSGGRGGRKPRIMNQRLTTRTRVILSKGVSGASVFRVLPAHRCQPGSTKKTGLPGFWWVKDVVAREHTGGGASPQSPPFLPGGGGFQSDPQAVRAALGAAKRSLDGEDRSAKNLARRNGSTSWLCTYRIRFPHYKPEYQKSRPLRGEALSGLVGEVLRGGG